MSSSAISMIKAWSDEAWEDYTYWQKQDKKTLRRINLLIKDIDRNGYDGIGKEHRCSLLENAELSVGILSEKEPRSNHSALAACQHPEIPCKHPYGE